MGEELALELVGSAVAAWMRRNDGEEIGSIANEEADTSLRNGLLGQWRKRLLEQ